MPRGSDRAMRAARARPVTPPAQPRPKMGNRSMVLARPRRLAKIAPKLDTASPVVAPITLATMSLIARPDTAMPRPTCSSKIGHGLLKTALRVAQPCGSARGTQGSETRCWY